MTLEIGEIRNQTVKIVSWHHAVICKNPVTAFLTVNDCLRLIRSDLVFLGYFSKEILEDPPALVI
ncbi:hypothetical protein D1151_16140 [Emergencia sp. 1XD21-10]|nr:hypothetical protein [Emergencia sp. 1XD21-10]